VFETYNRDTLNTLSNQANCHKFGRVLNSPPLDAKCKISIMWTCEETVMGPGMRVRSEEIWEEWNY